MDVGFSVSVPVVSPLFSDSLMAVTSSVTLEPAGITTWPAEFLTSAATVAVTSSPTLFLWDRISASVVAEKDAPDASSRPAVEAGAGLGVDAAVGTGEAAGAFDAGAGVAAGAAGFGLEAVGLGLGAAGLGSAGGGAVGVTGVAAAVSALGRSFSAALVSTGASCRSRFRLSAEATSRLSPRPHAAAASSASAASLILDIVSSSVCDLPGSLHVMTFHRS